MRNLILVAGVLAVAGCVSPPHLEEQPSGVGFRSYNEYQAEREALRQQQIREAQEREALQAQSADQNEIVEVPLTEDEQLAEEALQALEGLNEPIAEETLEPVDASEPISEETPDETISNAAISDEQDFEAVASRESIQSDAERISANRELYEVVQPTDLPQRPGNLGPNVVDYALATNNPLGTQLYRRNGTGNLNRFQRNCARYASSDIAQQDFLSKGGPERDRMGIDPDGDGFACYWDPTPFRNARNN